MVLGEIVERSSGRDFYEFADIYLFSKLDIDAQWWTDQSGNYLSYCCVDTTQEDFYNLIGDSKKLTEKKRKISFEKAGVIFPNF